MPIDPPQGDPTLLLAAVFVAVTVLVLGVGAMLARGPGLRRRMAPANADGVAARSGGPGSLRQQDTRWSGLLRRLEGVSLPDSAAEIGAMRLKLLQAGFLSPGAVRTFFVVRIVLAVLLPGILLLNAPMLMRSMELSQLLLASCCLILAGLYLPSFYIAMKASERKEAIGHAFPDALDMMVVCVEAGLGVDQVFGRVGAQIDNAHPMLAEQLALVSLELRAGRSRPDALKALADRTGVQEIRSFVTLLVQSEALGTSIATTLRVQADEMRNRRMMRAEERAHKLPVLLSLPLVVFILPTMIGVVMLPAIIRTVRDLFPAMGS